MQTGTRQSACPALKSSQKGTEYAKKCSIGLQTRINFTILCPQMSQRCPNDEKISKPRCFTYHGCGTLLRQMNVPQCPQMSQNVNFHQ